MSLMETIRKDQLEARKFRDTVAIGLLTALVGEAAMVGKNKGNRESTDEEVVGVVKKFIKNTEETITVLEKSSNTEALDKAKAELALLNIYLPKQMTEDEIGAFIDGFLASAPGSKMGDVMKALKDRHAGQYDGKMASAVAKAKLG